MPDQLQPQSPLGALGLQGPPKPIKKYFEEVGKELTWDAEKRQWYDPLEGADFDVNEDLMTMLGGIVPAAAVGLAGGPALVGTGLGMAGAGGMKMLGNWINEDPPTEDVLDVTATEGALGSGLIGKGLAFGGKAISAFGGAMPGQRFGRAAGAAGHAVGSGLEALGKFLDPYEWGKVLSGGAKKAPTPRPMPPAPIGPKPARLQPAGVASGADPESVMSRVKPQLDNPTITWMPTDPLSKARYADEAGMDPTAAFREATGTPPGRFLKQDDLTALGHLNATKPGQGEAFFRGAEVNIPKDLKWSNFGQSAMGQTPAGVKSPAVAGLGAVHGPRKIMIDGKWQDFDSLPPVMKKALEADAVPGTVPGPRMRK